ncbi:DUF2490 domain-containing protein [Pedobacter nanyangensis]|uniref:DUF2490 domain-containing protein n=1 Tax=Pedobacter nanyangensis TaxID=1562389 RepID=UPI001F05DC07|nr:DUF2490 domain-containing protein [Pedobacter nanyangensis]
MYRFKRLLATAMWVFIAQTLQAQKHYNAWFRSTLSVPVGEKFKVDNEFQHRRQSGFQNGNMLDNDLMFTFRNWVHYQHNPNLKFSVSPFAYFSHYRIIQDKPDKEAAPNSEVRFSVAEELQHKIYKRIYLVNRSLEQKSFMLLFKSFPDCLTIWRYGQDTEQVHSVARA